ncbi:MAG: hypothetical protein GEEBNDBF_02448 [bacterium]|nr:hypothetical protein [bacterium]
MRRIEPGDPESRTPDLRDGNIERLKQCFPEALSDGQIDFDLLRELLGDAVEESDEKYGLNWHGKRRARQLAMTPSTGTLRPCPEESVDWEGTTHLMIEGDNLEVLKLLQKSYAGKVKLIYIDPPYNTGKDFVYPDDYRDGIRNYLELTGQIDSDEAGQRRRVSSNTETSGRFHTNWLNMMYPRLRLARELLREDGVILASCDEIEQPRIRLMLDEIFGLENFVADFVWAAGRKNDSKLVSVSHEYILCYAKSTDHLRSSAVLWRQRKKGLDEIYAKYDQLLAQLGTDYDAISAQLKAWYKSLPDSHPAKAHDHYNKVDRRGVYFPDNISWPGGGGPQYEVLHPETLKPVRVPSRGWMTSDPAKMKAWIEEDRVQFGVDELSVPCIKAYLRDRERSAPYSVFYKDGRAATKRLRSLMGIDVFSYPKDETVLSEFVEFASSGGDIILDFFAGSGASGHSVMEQNLADASYRQYILVQLPEPLDHTIAEQKAAAEFCDSLGVPRNIAELTKERLRRAGRKIKTENPLFTGDTGFRVFKLDTSNIRAWHPRPDQPVQAMLESVEHLLEGRAELDLLYEILLKLGLELTVPVEARSITQRTVYAAGDPGGRLLFACLDHHITSADYEALALGITQWYEELGSPPDATAIFRDNAFVDDVAKVNLTQILAQHGLTNVLSL